MEPNFNIRQNTCPQCGRYIWAHPVVDTCTLTPGEALFIYAQQVAVNREYNKTRDRMERQMNE